MVQLVTRLHMNEAEHARCFAQSLLLVGGLFPFDERHVDSWPQSHVMAPHAWALLTRALDVQDGLADSSHLLLRVICYLYTVGALDASRMLIERGLQLHPDHGVAHALRYQLARNYLIGGELDLAQQILRALLLDEDAGEGPQGEYAIGTCSRRIISIGMNTQRPFVRPSWPTRA